jgi:hypothetical protein
MAAPTGRGMWIAFGNMIAKGDLDGIVAKLTAAKLSWVAPRAAVNGQRDGFFDATKLPTFIAKCAAAGILVYPWLYSRPTTWKSEIGLMQKFIAEGAAGVIIDAEDPWMSADPAMKANAARYMDEMRAALPDTWIAHCPFSYVQYHEGTFPYVEFGRGCDYVMDQLYWTEFSGAGAKAHCEKVDAQWAAWAAKHPDAYKGRTPIGVTYGSELGPKWKMAKAPPGPFRGDDLRFFLDRYDGPKSVYTLEAATDEALVILSEQPDPEPQKAPLIDETWLQRLNREADDRLNQWQPQTSTACSVFGDDWCPDAEDPWRGHTPETEIAT